MFEPTIPADHDTSQIVDGLVGAIHNLASDNNYKIVTNVFKENSDLREQNARLRLSHHELLEQYRGFRNELESRLESQKKELEGVIEEKQAELSSVAESKSQLEADLAVVNAKLEEEKQSVEEERRLKTNLQSELDDAKGSLESEKEATAKLEGELGQAKASLEEQKKLAEEGAKLVEEGKEAKMALEHELAETKSCLETEKATAEQEKTQKASFENELIEAKGGLEEERKRVESLSEEVAALQTSLSEKAIEIENLNNDISVVQEDLSKAKATTEELEKQLEALQLDLQNKNTTLAELERYTIALKKEPEDKYVAILDTIWTSIMDLAEATFSQDLEEMILGDSSCWSNLRGSEYLKHSIQIPLPQSNSQAAKQMRIGALIAVLSRALNKHVFRPLYLLDDDTNITTLLRRLEGENPAQELHCRSTLLAVLPEVEKKNAIKRVQTVVREISWLVQHLLSALQYESFCTGLEKACKLACTQWRKIQEAQMKIEPFFGPPYDEYDWQVLPLTDFDEGNRDGGNGVPLQDQTADSDTSVDIEAPSKSEDQVVDGEGSGGGGDGDADDEGSDAVTAIEDHVDPDAILMVVWPSMCAVENGELQSITQGLVISKEQARSAQEEVRAERGRRPGNKRARSMSFRRVSRPGSPRQPFATKKEEGEGGGDVTSSAT